MFGFLLGEGKRESVVWNRLLAEAQCPTITKVQVLQPYAGHFILAMFLPQAWFSNILWNSNDPHFLPNFIGLIYYQNAFRKT